jgi:putative DNA primase/helicase
VAPDDDLGAGVGIAEGIENALTAWQIMGGYGAWAAGTRNCVATFPVLRWAEAITIFADADDSGVGVDAARACAARWTAAGREALIHIPPAGRDWNDVARGRAA